MCLVESLVALLAPPRCLACARRAPPPWCPACRKVADHLAVRPACRRCGGPGTPRHGCWEEPSPVAATVAAYRYTGPVAAAVVAGKARGAWAGWEPLGALLATAVAAAAADEVAAVDVVTWVPADPGRRRERGADHARLLAGPVAAHLGVPLVAGLVAAPGRRDQAGRPLSERRVLPAEAFTPDRRFDGAHVGLVDDVLTTGATAAAAAAALGDAGAARVSLFVLARAGDHPLGRGDAGKSSNRG